MTHLAHVRHVLVYQVLQVAEEDLHHDVSQRRADRHQGQSYRLWTYSESNTNRSQHQQKQAETSHSQCESIESSVKIQSISTQCTHLELDLQGFVDAVAVAVQGRAALHECVPRVEDLHIE